MRDQILLWLAGRDGGLSSECVAFTALGIAGRRDHPHDPADLGRCLRLLETIPAIREGFEERMSAISPTWARLAQAWDELEAMMREEVGIHWEKDCRAPLTYKRMRQIIEATPPPAEEA